MNFTKLHVRISNVLKVSKRGKFVICVFFLSLCMFLSEYVSGKVIILAGFILASLTTFFLYFILRTDILRKRGIIPILILPFFYTLSFSLFYSLIPPRFLSKLILTALYAFGVYSLFLTENIFAISSLRTINLLRSARIVSFVITIFVLFFLFNVIFSLRFPIYITPVLVGFISFLMAIQFLWSYVGERDQGGREVSIFSAILAIMMTELACVLTLWPVTPAIYAIFLTGIFYTYSGLSHIWIERRLFKGILWEYVWVGILSILFLVIFSKWGI